MLEDEIIIDVVNKHKKLGNKQITLIDLLMKSKCTTGCISWVIDMLEDCDILGPSISSKGIDTPDYFIWASMSYIDR